MIFVKETQSHTLTLNSIADVNELNNELKDFCSAYIAESIKNSDDSETIS